MVKGIFYTDYHLANKRPVNRNDDFSKNQILKLKEVYDFAAEHKADFVLFGGDFFHTHRIYNYELIGDALEIIINSPITTYAVQGQHDLIGHNRESYSKSTLYFFEKYSRKKFQSLYEPIEFGNVVIHPCHWFDNLESICNKDIDRSKINVLLAHQSISKKKYIFDTVLTKNIKSNFNLILSGDIHSGHEEHKIENTIFYNSGSLTRLNIKDRNRIPKIALLEFDKKVKLTEYELKSFQKDVFNYTELQNEEKQISSEDESKFFEEILALEQESTDLMDLIQKAAKQKKISSDVLEYISQKAASI